jgi:hypothetical protein
VCVVEFEGVTGIPGIGSFIPNARTQNNATTIKTRATARSLGKIENKPSKARPIIAQPATKFTMVGIQVRLDTLGRTRAINAIISDVQVGPILIAG